MLVDCAMLINSYIVDITEDEVYAEDHSLCVEKTS